MKLYGLFALVLSASVSMGDISVPDKVQDTEEIVVLKENSEAGYESEVYAEEDYDELTRMAVIYLTDTYSVRQAPDLAAEEVVEVEGGQTVFVDSMDIYQGNAWFGVHTYIGENRFDGFVEERYLAYSNEEMLAWKKENLPEEQIPILKSGMTADVMQFPESYQQELAKLKAKHPNWIFVRVNTGLDWKYVIDSEYAPAKQKSLIGKYRADSWKENDIQVQPGWVCASRGIVEYYMDSRNFLNERDIFQFEQLTYNSSYHTQEALQQFLGNTFMNGNVPGESISYAALFCQVGSSMQISPFHLASRVWQEQGQGTSALISGTYPGYEGYYNYFNVKASGSTEKEIIENGLAYAKEKGWNSPSASIAGGASTLALNYILKGQDTLYFQKFNVLRDSPYGLFNHQYMQNIEAPYSEGRRIGQLYENANSLGSTFVFKIPVYENMYKHASAKPADYADLNRNAWYYPYVSYASQQGIMVGNGSGFLPDANVTRSQMATILYSVNGKPQTNFQNIFSDVSGGEWYSEAVTWAYTQGIVAGYDTGLFGPDNMITRQELLVMMYKTAQMNGKDTSYDVSVLNNYYDGYAVAEWAKPAVSWAVKNGVIAGTDGFLAPDRHTTRAECATIVYSFTAI